MNKNKESFFGNILNGVRSATKGNKREKYKQAGLTWYQEKRLKHLPYNRLHSYKLGGRTIYFNNGPELLHSLREIYIQEIYKIQFNTATPYIIDCGANIGLAIMYLKTLYPQCGIVAFEPDPVNFDLLKKNISGGNWSDVELRNEAIWKENTTISFVNDGTMGSKIDQDNNHTTHIEVKATRLKDLLQRKVDFLKIDIEGAEYEVLKDCADSLHRVDQLFIEFHGHFHKMNELTEILQLTEANRFSYYIKEADNVYPTPFYRQRNKPLYDLQLNIFCFRDPINK